MSFAWLVVMAFLMLGYAFLDGYDLGLGTLSLFEKDKRRRHGMIEDVADVWDGNETWLVMIGVGLWAGLPVAYGALLPHMYLPTFIMLFGLIFRGACVEIISQSHGKVGEGYYVGFGLGSLIAAFAQGWMLGTLSIPVVLDAGLSLAGDPLSWLGWYPLLVGLTFVAMYVAFAYAFLRTRPGIVAERDAAAGRGATIAAAVLLLVSIFSLQATEAKLNLGGGRALPFVVALLIAAAGAAWALRGYGHPVSSEGRKPLGVLWGNYLMVFGAFLAVAIARLPELAPGLNLYQAAAPRDTNKFILTFVLFGIVIAALLMWFTHTTLVRANPNSIWSHRKEVSNEPLD